MRSSTGCRKTPTITKTRPSSGRRVTTEAAGTDFSRRLRLSPRGGEPDGGQGREFLDGGADRKSRRVVVHCAQGVRRTGMMVAAYQESVVGFDRDRAKAAMLTFGHSQRTVGDVQRFIDVYDSKE